MLNIRELEKRWLSYKIKSYIPYATITVSSIIIVLTVYFFINSNAVEIQAEYPVKKDVAIVKNAPLKPSVKKEVVTEVKSVTHQESLKKQEKRVEISSKETSTDSETSTKLSPSLNFMNNMQHSSLPYYQEEKKKEIQDIKEKVQVIEKIQSAPSNSHQIIEEVQELDVVENEQTQNIEESPKKISIQRRNTQDDISHVIKRFKNNNNPALSLFIAKKYYELGEYHKAYNYSLITNEINSDIEASWIIFAKSLVKLNKKDMAISTLKRYIESSHSSSAKILLDDIVLGKFK